MKPLILLSFLAAGCCITTGSAAQWVRAKTLTGNDTLIRMNLSRTITGSLPADTIIDRLKKIPNNRMPGYNMPNAFKMQVRPDVYEGNNGRGQDIYRSQLDNMAILKPDSSSAGYMPNAIAPPPTRPSITDENGDVRWGPVQKKPVPKLAVPRQQNTPAPKQ